MRVERTALRYGRRVLDCLESGEEEKEEEDRKSEDASVTSIVLLDHIQGFSSTKCSGEGIL